MSRVNKLRISRENELLRASDISPCHVPYLHKKYGLSELRRKLKSGALCVAVEEEFGYGNWLWFPQISPEELIQKWQAAPAWGFAGWRKFLGGRWMNENDYSGVSGDGITPYSRFLDLWSAQHQWEINWVANLCCDADSYLWAPDGRSYTHQGFNGLRDRTRHPYERSRDRLT